MLRGRRLLLDCWIDVQRRWVYLEGLFVGSPEIQTLLPKESNKFTGLNTEFTHVMSKASKSPKIVEVLSIPNVQQTLERIGSGLGHLQKALGEFLERQRAAFSRFYFVGDEDLLEIIGNGRDPNLVQRHLPKMFAGIHSLEVKQAPSSKPGGPPGDAIVSAMVSKQSEVVPFSAPVDVAADPRVNAWLSATESAMKAALISQLDKAVMGVSAMYEGDAVNVELYTEWADAFAAQVILLASGVRWSAEVDAALAARKSQPTALAGPIARVLSVLSALASKVMLPLSPERRSKYEQLITELVHERDVTRSLDKHGIADANDFEWLSQLRYCWTGGAASTPLPSTGRVTRATAAAAATAEASLRVCLANASFPYGFEYLGVGERLVQTPLTDRCYLTLTQALHLRLGGNPFGPAGTGKTESVKALGSQLGRFVLVFNCDEHFDFKAMGRIFVGLCQVGAWGCFDEFNRLEERILSAVSSQILAIQTALLRDVSRTLCAGPFVFWFLLAFHPCIPHRHPPWS